MHPAWYRESQCFCRNEHRLSIVLSIVCCTNICGLTRPDCASKLPSPHRTVVAFVPIVLSAFPDHQQHYYRMRAKIVISLQPRGPRLQQDWRNAWDSYRARYRLPLSAAVLPSKSPHTPSALGNRCNTRQPDNSAATATPTSNIVTQHPDRVHIYPGSHRVYEAARFSHANGAGRLFRAASRKLSLQHDDVAVNP